ncbi:MAG: SMC-Scp complex subunit ScpB [FCB group bacterium]|nr:SMC-Scp complex subunit ScpB [FCB group bacterium]
MENGFKYSVVEALILASPEPLSIQKIAGMLDGFTPSKVTAAVAELNNRYMQAGSSFRIREIAGGFQFYILPEFTGYVKEMFSRRRKVRLTRAALETLAIVAYRQPVTKSEIEHIRGVASDGVIHNLIEKNMLTIKGRAKTVGKPLQYGTTDEFLKFFGLNSLEDLPKMSEIEELVASHDDNSQPELPLEHKKASEDEPVKLNIADGSFDPDRQIEVDDVTGEVVVTETTADNISETAEKKEKQTIASEDNNEQQPEIIVDMDAT